MKTKKDQWAKEYVDTEIFNAVVMGNELPGVEAVFKAGFDKAVKEVDRYAESIGLLADDETTGTGKWELCGKMYAHIKKLGSEPVDEAK